ncbi:hypothetical protein [Winogradskyella haliclonae]|uniref:Uncharacterized protein n=1 Tax=Winogradskyella haliclonae TaxID=2048558 RepID=A0ABQ2BWR7_9FLAO|nr:hypothetical protein [Winogradskyella haliclonae]GGI56890.1 hypothetical protein GCM10011444_11990 [Winogradskyella haliclonae]
MPDKKLKYQEQIDTFDPDLTGFYERDRDSFRFVHKDNDDERNFLPAFVIDENRTQNNFRGFGLSFFEDETKAINRYTLLNNDMPNIHKKIGTHLAKGFIESEDGISDDANEFSHFTLLEYEDVEISGKFSQSIRIYND